MLAPWKKIYDNLWWCIKQQRLHFANKGPYCQIYGFSSSHIQTWEADHKECWAPKNWCFWTVVLEKILESLLNSLEIKPVNSKENRSWIFIGRTDMKLQCFGHLMWRAETRWKRPWCWERLRAGGEGGGRGWDDWVASSPQWIWVWASSWRWWKTKT